MSEAVIFEIGIYVLYIQSIDPRALKAIETFWIINLTCNISLC